MKRSNGTRIKSRIPATTAVFALALVLVAGYAAFGNSLTTEPTDLPEPPVEIYSAIVPTLVEHTHENLDSIIDLEHGEMVGMEDSPYVLDRDIWVTGFTWEIENAPLSTLHHFVLSRQDRPAPLCPNGASFHEEILTVGSDAGANGSAFPPGYALYLAKGTPLHLETMMHNPKPPFGPGETHQNVRLKVNLHVGSPEKEYRSVRAIRLSVEDPACTSKSGTFDVPANVEHFEKTMQSPMSSYTFEHDATIVRMGGHVHGWAGGEQIRVFLNGEQFESFTSRLATKDPWSWVTGAKNIYREVRASDEISISAIYSNPHNEPLIHEAMGMMLFYFAEER